MNPSGRFEPLERVAFDDGWESLEDMPPFRTEVQVERPREVHAAIDAFLTEHAL